MKIDFLSDIHIDFWVREINPQSPKFQKQMDNLFEITNIKGGDVFIIPGDLGHYFTQDTEFLKRLKSMYKYVLVTYGNHDMYLISKSIKNKYKLNSMNRLNEMKQFCEDNDIIYLEGNVVTLEGVTFAGTGMSWDDSYYEFLRGAKPSEELLFEKFKDIMNDANLIYGGSDNYSISTAYGGRHKVSSFNPFEFFRNEKDKLHDICNSKKNIDVMISHYSPVVPPNIPDEFKRDISSTFYYFNGEEEIKKINAKYWLFGHTHVRYDFIHNNTRFLCNPFGYPGENKHTVVQTIEI